MKQVARHALRVDADQRGNTGLDVAHDQGQVQSRIDGRAVGHEAEEAEPRREFDFDLSPHQLLVEPAIRDQVGNRHQFQVELVREASELRQPRHRPVVIEDLAEHARGVEPRKAAQIHGGFGMSGPLQHAALLRLEREDVPRPGQVGWRRARIDEQPDGLRTIVGGNAGCDPRRRVDGDGERGAQRRRIASDHRVEPQFLKALAGRRQADQPATVLAEEVDGGGIDLLRGHDEIALVLAVLVIDDDDDFPLPECSDGVLDRVQMNL